MKYCVNKAGEPTETGLKDEGVGDNVLDTPLTPKVGQLLALPQAFYPRQNKLVVPNKSSLVVEKLIHKSYSRSTSHVKPISAISLPDVLGKSLVALIHLSHSFQRGFQTIMAAPKDYGPLVSSTGMMLN